MQNSDLWKSYLKLVKETYSEARMLELVNNLDSVIDNALEEIDDFYLETTDSIEFLLEEFLLDCKLEDSEDKGSITL